MSRQTTRAFLLLALLPCGAALAQYSPDATVDLGTGYGQTALSQSTLSNTRDIGATKSSPSESSASRTASAARNLQTQSLDRELAWITPEYKRRVRTDGQASADRWLAQTARALGQRNGQQSRKRNGR